jgi:hypothetical protein
MNKIKMIVVVAIMATITSCGTPTKQESADFMLDAPMSNYHKWHGMFVSHDTIDAINPYNIIVGKEIYMRWSKASNITELHADGGITCDTIWYKFIGVHATTPMYECDK